MSPLKHNDPFIYELEEELFLLKTRFQMAHELTVKWIPTTTSTKSGEVIGNTIYIYEEKEQAKETLQHEFIDYLVTTEVLGPSQKLINKLITLVEELIYERKEYFIEKLLKAL